MTARVHDRLFAACGIVFVVLELGGTFLAMASGKTHDLTVTTSTAKLAEAIASPVGTGVWAGAYMELLSIGFFLAFAVWAATKLGGGLLGSVTRAAAYANAGAGVGALAVMNTISYQAGHGISLGTARTLTVLSESIYVSTWFLTAAFLTAAGILAIRAGRRVLGWSGSPPTRSCSHRSRSTTSVSSRSCSGSSGSSAQASRSSAARAVCRCPQSRPASDPTDRRRPERLHGTQPLGPPRQQVPTASAVDVSTMCRLSVDSYCAPTVWPSNVVTAIWALGRSVV